MTPRSSARLRLVAAAALFSTGGAAIKACELGGWQVAGLRSAVAAATLLLLVPASRRLRSPAVWLVGAAYAGCVLSYAVANKLTTAANTIFLQSTAPLYLLLLSPLLLGERIRRRDLVFMAALALGLSLFFVGEEQVSAVAADPFTGNLLGLVAGLCWALTLLGLRWLERETAGGVGTVPHGGDGIRRCLGRVLVEHDDTIHVRRQIVDPARYILTSANVRAHCYHLRAALT